MLQHHPPHNFKQKKSLKDTIKQTAAKWGTKRISAMAKFVIENIVALLSSLRRF